jgi:hypothetical protein
VVFSNNEIVVDQPVASYVPNAWNTFALQAPVLIEAGKDIKFGIKVRTHQFDELVISLDNSYAIDKEGNLYSENNGATWLKLSDEDIVDNLAIIGDITDTNQPTISQRDDAFIGYVMFRNGQPQGNVLYQTKYKDMDANGSANHQYALSAYYNNGMESQNSESFILNIKELLNNKIFNIYPNPTTGELTIETCDLRYETSDLRYEIYDVYGKKISNLKSQISNHQINISHLPAGIYFLKIDSGTKTSVCKVIKQ